MTLLLATGISQVYVINHLNEGADKLQVLKTVKVRRPSHSIYLVVATLKYPPLRRMTLPQRKGS